MSAGAALQGMVRELVLVGQRGGQVWRLLPRQRRLILGLASIIMALTSAANTVVALLLGRLVDRVQIGLETAAYQEAYWAALGVLSCLAGIFFAREVLHVVRRTLVENVCTRINRDMQLRLVEHVLKSDLVAMTSEKVGALHGKIFRNVDGFVRFVRLMFLDFLPALFVGVFALTAAVAKQPLLGLVMVGVVPIAALLTIRQLRTQKAVRVQLMRDCEEIDGTLIEQLSGAEYIRVANTYRLEMDRLGQCAEKRRRREIKHHFEMSLYGCAKALNEAFFHLLVLAVAVHLALQGRISYGDIVAFSVLFLNVMTPLTELHRILDEGHEASLRVGDMLHMLREPEDCSFATAAGAPVVLSMRKPAIQVHDLYVRYAASEETSRRALDRLSLTIHHGETIGIAGRSGSGKSTLIKTLLRLVHPQEGTVYLDGLPLRDVNRAELARLIGYVGQAPFVFSGTIAENIAYGNPPASLEAIHEAARLANFHEEILEMPGGYQAPVAERGHNLSGGQRQRLALARILLKQAPILILDEATSALDNISERHVQHSLRATGGERTTILIAHRLTTLKDCDRIFVFADGSVVQTGTYDELEQQAGLFSDLVRCAERGTQPITSPVRDFAEEKPRGF
jgi:ATP-binding cassette subfamily B protein